MKNLNKYYIILGALAILLMVFGGILGVIAGIYIFGLLFKHSRKEDEDK